MLAVLLSQLPNAGEIRGTILQLRIIGAKIRTTGSCSIVAAAGCRRSGLKILGSREFLTNEP